jgi:hypothetical protein
VLAELAKITQTFRHRATAQIVACHEQRIKEAGAWPKNAQDPLNFPHTRQYLKSGRGSMIYKFARMSCLLSNFPSAASLHD